MPYSSDKYRVVQMKKELYDQLDTIAKRISDEQGVSFVSRPMVIEILIKNYEEKHNLKTATG